MPPHSIHGRAHECTTTGPDVSLSLKPRYVGCSINPADMQPLLIHTDEDSGPYLKEVQLQLAYRGGISDVHVLDARLRRDYPADNFMVFAIEVAIDRLATQRLALRPNERCRRCDRDTPSSRAFWWGQEFPVAFAGPSTRVPA